MAKTLFVYLMNEFIIKINTDLSSLSSVHYH